MKAYLFHATFVLSAVLAVGPLRAQAVTADLPAASPEVQVSGRILFERRLHAAVE